MRRWLSVLLLAAMLCGCTNISSQPETLPPEDSVTVPTDPGYYVPGDNLETESGGAVKVFRPQDGTPLHLMLMGSDLLLFEQERLTVLEGERLTVAASVQLENLPDPASGLIRTKADAVAYYDETAGQMVFLGSNLSQTMCLQLPEAHMGKAWLSPDWKTVYYCTDAAIWAMDIHTGISRMVKEQGNAKQQLTGLLLNGTLLRCTQEYEDGTGRTVLISPQTGQTVYEGAAAAKLATWDDMYALPLESSLLSQWVYGDENLCRSLWPAGKTETLQMLPEHGAAVAACREEDGLQLDYYDLSTGRRSSSVKLKGLGQVRSLVADDVNHVIWVLSDGTVCRWEPEKSPVEDETIYTEPFYTREQPDTEGLSALQAELQRLEQSYGLEILIWNEADAVLPMDHAVETEYLPRIYKEAFSRLEENFKQFPENFFRTAAKPSANKKLTVCLVRSVRGHHQGSVQYWLDGNMYITLEMSDTMAQSFCHAVSHAIETRVMSTTSRFYEWHKLNPGDFQYGSDGTTDPDRYLAEENRWFVDKFSMSSEVEDRASILEYACTPGKEAFFKTEMMQNKLKRICTGIREAFGLKSAEQPLLWEQYLQ